MTQLSNHTIWQPQHLENDLVQLIPLRPEHFEALYQVASDPEIWRQHPKKNRYEREVFLRYFEHAIKHRAAFIILDKKTETVIGSSGYYNYDPERPAILIGYTFLACAFWGGTYNKAVKCLLLDHAFQHVENVYFHIGADNIRSRIAIERIGAVRELEFINEEGMREFAYVITKKDWISRKS